MTRPSAEALAETYGVTLERATRAAATLDVKREFDPPVEIRRITVELDDAALRVAEALGGIVRLWTLARKHDRVEADEQAHTALSSLAIIAEDLDDTQREVRDVEGHFYCGRWHAEASS